MIKIKNTMKLKYIFALSIIINICAHAKEEVLPEDLQSLINQRNISISKIDKDFVEQLEKLKIAYTKKGDLDVAVKINELSKKFAVQWFEGTKWKIENFTIQFEDKLVKHDYPDASVADKTFEYKISEDGLVSYKGLYRNLTLQFNEDKKSGVYRDSTGKTGTISLIEK